MKNFAAELDNRQMLLSAFVIQFAVDVQSIQYSIIHRGNLKIKTVREHAYIPIQAKE